MKKYWWIFLAIAVVASIIALGIPKTDWPGEEQGEQKNKGEGSPIDAVPEREPVYTAPALPEVDKKERQKELTPPLERVRPLTPEQEQLLKATDYNAYIRYRAKLEGETELEKMDSAQIIRERIGPRLKAQLEANAQKAEETQKNAE